MLNVVYGDLFFYLKLYLHKIQVEEIHNGIKHLRQQYSNSFRPAEVFGDCVSLNFALSKRALCIYGQGDVYRVYQRITNIDA